MIDDTGEFEPEVLSYQSFCNRQALRAWRERRRAHERRERLGRSGTALVRAGARLLSTFRTPSDQYADKN
jgi:hypothetical protein